MAGKAGYRVAGRHRAVFAVEVSGMTERDVVAELMGHGGGWVSARPGAEGIRAAELRTCTPGNRQDATDRRHQCDSTESDEQESTQATDPGNADSALNDWWDRP